MQGWSVCGGGAGGGVRERQIPCVVFAPLLCFKGTRCIARSSADAYRHREPRKFTSDGSLRAQRMCAVSGVLSVGECAEDIFVSVRRSVEAEMKKSLLLSSLSSALHLADSHSFSSGMLTRCIVGHCECKRSTFGQQAGLR